jgi:hypothetical protein
MGTTARSFVFAALRQYAETKARECSVLADAREERSAFEAELRSEEARALIDALAELPGEDAIGSLRQLARARGTDAAWEAYACVKYRLDRAGAVLVAA